MSDFERNINQAIGELNYAKHLGPMAAECSLIAARSNINQALDEVRREGARRPLYLHLDNHKRKT